MVSTDSFEEFSQRFNDAQRRLFAIWMDATVNPLALNSLNIPETFDKTVKFQQEIVDISLELQAIGTDALVTAQKQYWNNYFQMIPTFSR
ncbi:MAG: hypothetical protein AAF316_01585 [Cyanobacteria bacterium P01_A01_bin.80]